MPDRLRLFVALEIPGEVDEALDVAVEAWRARLPTARWVPRDRRHVTLKFIGMTAPESVEAIASRLEDVGRVSSSFETPLGAMGAFPSERRARTLWAGLDDAGGAMGALSIRIDEALADLVAPERRAFHPHITLARCEPPARLPTAYVATPIRRASVRARSISLASSRLGQGGPRYETLARAPLHG